MPYIPSETVAKAREMDLLTYLTNYEPNELVKTGGNSYHTRTHDSLKLSNGKWFWHSRGFGGRSALDYLIKVKELPFIEAVEIITGQAAAMPPVFVSQPKPEQPKTLLLPQASRSTARVTRYLAGRGIDRELIDYCIQTGRLFESEPYHNVVFVGKDADGKARYANLRGIGTDFKGEASGSDKHFSFSLPATGESDTVHLFESAIDLLSYATLCKLEGLPWDRHHLLSLAGIYRPREDAPSTTLPTALTQFLADHPDTKRIVLRLDNDQAGRLISRHLLAALSEKHTVLAKFPPRGKDYNDFLCMRQGLALVQNHPRPKER